MGPEWRWKGAENLHREHGTVLTLMSSQISNSKPPKFPDLFYSHMGLYQTRSLTLEEFE